MNICKICGKHFEYATSTLPYNICLKCYRAYVHIIEVKPKKEDLLEHYADMIDVCLNQNENHYKEIKENKQLVKHYNKLISELLKSS